MNFAPGGLLHDTRYLGDTFRQRETFARQRRRWANRLNRMSKPQQQAILTSLLDVFNADLPSPEPPVHRTPASSPVADGSAVLPPAIHPYLIPVAESYDLSA